jgi:hypothetical protein
VAIRDAEGVGEQEEGEGGTDVKNGTAPFIGRAPKRMPKKMARICLSQCSVSNNKSYAGGGRDKCLSGTEQNTRYGVFIHILVLLSQHK